ncbi:Crp/Fnr family transcriptional regulator [Spirillospora sp. CA-255316]
MAAELQRLRGHPSRRRICHLLCRLIERHGGPVAGPTTLQLTRADIADWVGPSVRTVERELGRLTRAGILSPGTRGRVIILNVEELRRYADTDG